jgi:tRNA (guanine-N7-)-methyltransferase
VSDPHFRRTVSYVRRTERLTEAQQRVWDTRRDAYLVDVPRGAGGTLSADPSWVFDAPAIFGRSAPLVVEIGTGQGENVVAAAAASPGRDFLGVEVYTPGVARAMVRAEAHDPGVGLPNLRMAQVNAVDLLATALPEASVNELWVFFPDPWPKKKHQKRRMLSPEFAELIARVLRPGGTLRMATDWPHYADQILEVFDAAPGFTNAAGAGNFAERFEGRVMTAFEARGLKAARPIADLTYRRV